MAQKELLTNEKAFKRTDDRWGGIVWYIDEKGKRKSFSNTTVSGLHLKNWKLSSYLNCLSEHGFLIQRVVEESTYEQAEANLFREGKYYSGGKARLINPVIIVKSKKL